MERGSCRVCPAHTAPGTRAESRTVAEGITLCIQGRGIPANSVQSHTPEGPCLLLVQLSPFLWKRIGTNSIRNPLGLFFLTAFSKRCQLSQFAVTKLFTLLVKIKSQLSAQNNASRAGPGRREGRSASYSFPTVLRGTQRAFWLYLCMYKHTSRDCSY